MRRSKTAAEHTRQSILDAALVLFDEQGYAQTGINAIAQKIGATRGAVYGHFANKEAILAALADAEFNIVVERNAAAMASEHIWHSLADSLTALFDDLLRCPVRMRLFRIIHQQKQSSDTMRALRQHHQAQWQAQCREAIARSKTNGELPAHADTDYLIFHIDVLTWGLLEYCLHNEPESIPPGYIARTIRTTMNALQQQ